MYSGCSASDTRRGVVLHVIMVIRKHMLFQAIEAADLSMVETVQGANYTGNYTLKPELIIWLYTFTTGLIKMKFRLRTLSLCEILWYVVTTPKSYLQM